MGFYPPCTLYVILCQTPKTFYVGTTYRSLSKRLAEHFEDGKGSNWTIRHGCKRVVAKWEVSRATGSRVENEVWMWYAREYGPERVRGGDVTVVLPDNDDSIPDYLLPEEFGGTRIVHWG